MLIIPGHFEDKVSRGSGQNSRQSVYVNEKREILTGCSACGKSLSQVKKALSGFLEQHAQKKCIMCGKRPPHPGWTMCDDCAEKFGK